MSHRKALIQAIGLITLGLGCLTGCIDQEQHDRPFPRAWAEEAGKAAIAQYDSNHNGVIDAAELERTPALKSSFKQVARNRDGAITADAIAKRIRIWDERGARQLVRCFVTRNKVPLSNVEVRFVPEDFLKEHVTVAHGKTGDDGVTEPTVDWLLPDEPRGVPPGFYRIEITSPTERIPDRYNSHTVLGIEVIYGSPDLAADICIDVSTDPSERDNS